MLVTHHVEEIPVGLHPRAAAARGRRRGAAGPIEQVLTAELLGATFGLRARRGAPRRPLGGARALTRSRCSRAAARTVRSRHGPLGVVADRARACSLVGEILTTSLVLAMIAGGAATAAHRGRAAAAVRALQLGGRSPSSSLALLLVVRPMRPAPHAQPLRRSAPASPRSWAPTPRCSSRSTVATGASSSPARSGRRARTTADRCIAPGRARPGHRDLGRHRAGRLTARHSDERTTMVATSRGGAARRL